MMRAEQGRESLTAGALQSRSSAAHGIANEICSLTRRAMRDGWGRSRGERRREGGVGEKGRKEAGRNNSRRRESDEK